MIRPATPGDAETLTALERSTSLASLAHVFGSPYPTADVLDRWCRVLADPRVVTLLVEDPEPVAYAAFGDGRLRHFGVHPDRYGTGLADDLLAEVVRRCVGPLHLWVLEENNRARAFYCRNGWHPSGQRQTSEFPPYPVELRYEREPT